MRILFLSNFYPPADLGGWEQWCQEVADAFMERGHEVIVLTSRFRADAIPGPEPHVHRVLYLESDLDNYRPRDHFLNLGRRERFNLDYLEKLIDEFRPDVVWVWGMWQLTPQLAVLAEDLCPGRVVYYFCGFWPVKELEQDPHTQYWQNWSEAGGWTGIVMRPVGRLALQRLARRRRRVPQLRHVACVSRFVLEHFREAGVPLPGARVIFGGIDLGSFYRSLDADLNAGQDTGPLELLFAGSVSAEKGVDTAVHAMAEVAKEHGAAAVHLTIVGTGHQSFVDSIQRFVRGQGIEPYITFRGRIPKEDMPHLLHGYDVLLFPSAWEEPLARMMMEGLAAGLVLVSTTTGGSKEFLEHGRNSLTFQAGDAHDLATQIRRLLDEPHLVRQLAAAGQQMALECFALERMIDEMEAFLMEVKTLAASGPSPELDTRKGRS